MRLVAVSASSLGALTPIAFVDLSAVPDNADAVSYGNALATIFEDTGRSIDFCGLPDCPHEVGVGFRAVRGTDPLDLPLITFRRRL